MALSWDQIVDIMTARRIDRSPLVAEMADVCARYNGEVVVVRPDVSGKPSMKPPSPTLVADSIDYVAMRSSLYRPTIHTPPLDIGSETSVRRAANRRRALYARWHESALADILLRRAYRHFAGYGTACLIVVPDHEYGAARVELRDPLTAYPDYRSPDDWRAPTNIGFVFGRSVDWVLRRYPATASLFDRRTRSNDVVDLVEWIDEDQIVMGVLGLRDSRDGTGWFNHRPAARGMQLRRWPNRAGMVPVAMPHRVTLNRIAGQIASVLHSVDLLDHLMVLDTLAAEKAIFPDFVVLGRDGREPRLISGAWKDGRTGEPNVIQDGEVKVLQTSPGPLTHPVIDRQERIVRLHTGFIPQAGGETPGALRTGRAIDSIGGFSIDPRVQEAQEVMARSLVVVNEALMRTEEGWWPTKRYTCFSGWPGDPGHVTYVPQEDYESKDNAVTYTFPGTDVSEISVAVTQLNGARLMSKHTGRVKHPLIEDPDHEEALITAEALTETALTAMLEQARMGTLGLVDLANILAKTLEGKRIVEALVEAQAEAQERQATPAEVPPDAPPGALAPGTQPGLSAPGVAGVEQPPAPPAIPPPEEGLANMRELFNALAAQP